MLKIWFIYQIEVRMSSELYCETTNVRQQWRNSYKISGEICTVYKVYTQVFLKAAVCKGNEVSKTHYQQIIENHMCIHTVYSQVEFRNVNVCLIGWW